MIVKCENCEKKFKFLEIENSFPGGLSKESIYCPWCNKVITEIMTSGIIKTEKIN